MKGIIGKKVGMTQVFDDKGNAVPVTVIQAGPCYVTQVRTAEKDGYTAIQLGFGEAKPARLTKGQLGHLQRNNLPALRHLREFRVLGGADVTEGAQIKADVFARGERVDVIGTSKGRGFAGTIKRHNFNAQDATHGNSISHRAPGSIGQRQTPGRVFKGKRMSGHMGNVVRSIPNLAVVRVDKDRNLLLIKGAVPGHAGSHVVVKPAAKVRRKRKG